MAVSVLIVDDHPSFRHFARRLLEQAGFQVVGEAEDGAGEIEAARELEPAAVLLDVVLPDLRVVCSWACTCGCFSRPW